MMIHVAHRSFVHSCAPSTVYEHPPSFLPVLTYPGSVLAVRLREDNAAFTYELSVYHAHGRVHVTMCMPGFEACMGKQM